LISPNTEELEPWAKANGITYTSIEELTTKPEVKALYDEVVNKTNDSLARYEQIKQFAVLPLMLSIEGGHLTPTMKVKRKVVNQKYADIIEAFYGAS
jgi:long-chain acyl-CoA synthetase